MNKEISGFNQKSYFENKNSKRRKIVAFGAVGILIVGITLATLTQNNFLGGSFYINAKAREGFIYLNDQQILEGDSIDLVRGGKYDETISLKDLPMTKDAIVASANRFSTKDDELAFQAKLSQADGNSWLYGNLRLFVSTLKTNLSDMFNFSDIDNYLNNFFLRIGSYDLPNSPKDNQDINETLKDSTRIGCLINLSLGEILKADINNIDSVVSGCVGPKGETISVSDSLERFNSSDVTIGNKDSSFTILSSFEYIGEDIIVSDPRGPSIDVFMPNIEIKFIEK